MLLPTTTAPARARARAFQLFVRCRAFQALLAILLFFNLLVFSPRRASTAHLQEEVQARPSPFPSNPNAAQKIGRVYITSLLKDNEEILKAGWADAVVNLTLALGPENVWVSIHESGSRDGTQKELRKLESRLQELGSSKHEINMADVGDDMENMVPRNGPGWIEVQGRRMMRRIPWLAELRNLNTGPLTRLAAQNVTFEKILFLNDVIFTSDDALELLLTRDGDYAAACGFDYSRPWPAVAFYDQFATRDANGEELVALYYPYFAAGKSRDALLQGLPIPVRSCWSGIAAFDAAPFQDLRHPLRFRAINDSLAENYLEASECCLVHYDNPLSALRGVWMNPNVRVGYSKERYDAVHRPSGWSSATAISLGRLSEFLTKISRLNVRRRRLINQRYEEWAQKSILNTEVGSDCLVNKMMVVSENGTWSEVMEPAFGAKE